jgi:transketolase N-terminal domain/subunit
MVSGYENYFINRNTAFIVIGKAGCDASGGSLGHGLGIGIGYALADRKRDVYVIVSEGSMMEGSSWEALRIIDDLKLTNVKIHTNFNGYSAVAKIDDITLAERMKAFVPDITVHFTKNGEGFDGIEGHYKKA